MFSPFGKVDVGLIKWARREKQKQKKEKDRCGGPFAWFKNYNVTVTYS